MPHRLADVIRAGPGPDLGRVAADGVVPLLRLEEPDGAAEEARRHEVEHARRDDEEVLQLHERAAPRSHQSLVQQTACEGRAYLYIA